MFNKERYEREKRLVANNIADHLKTPKEYMHEYKRAIIEEDYEKAKAITDILEPLNYFTIDTHQHLFK